MGYMVTERAFLRSIGRVDVDQRHASYGSLVGNEFSELVETPRVVITSLGLPNRCPLSDSLEIFKGYQGKGVFSLRNQLLRDAVISIFSKSCHPTRKLLEMSLSGFGSNALEFCLKGVGFRSNVLDFLTRMYLSITIYSQVLDSKIDTKNSFGIIRCFFRNFDYDAEIENAFDQNKIGLASNPIHPRFLIFSKANRNSLPALKCNQRDLFKPFPGEDAGIIDDSSIESKFWLDGLVSLISLADLGNGSDCELCGESKMFSNRIVNRLMDLNLVGTMQSEDDLCYVITSFVKPLHCIAEHLMLLWRGIELYHQGLKHCIEDFLQWIYSYRTQLLPTLKDGVSAAEVLR